MEVPLTGFASSVLAADICDLKRQKQLVHSMLSKACQPIYCYFLAEGKFCDIYFIVKELVETLSSWLFPFAA